MDIVGKLFDAVLNLKPFRGYRTQIIQVLMALLGGYQALATNPQLEGILKVNIPEVNVTIFTLAMTFLTERGLSFAKAHTPPA